MSRGRAKKNENAKIAYIIAAMCLLVLSLSACTFKSKDPVIASLGRAMSVRRYSCAGFGDSTDFGIYTFPGASPGENEYFKPVTAESKTELLGYIDEFEQVIDAMRDGDEGADLVNNYRFSRDDIDGSDYLYIYDREGKPIGDGAYSKYDYYNVYFFDSQTTTLYYFHNNI